jgi:hypothetical protein
MRRQTETGLEILSRAEEIFIFSQKNRFSRLTVFFRWLPCLSRLKRDSRSRKTKELVLAYFGTANWNSILSRHDERQRELSPEIKLGFFVG